VVQNLSCVELRMGVNDGIPNLLDCVRVALRGHSLGTWDLHEWLFEGKRSRRGLTAVVKEK
jgi:hypothetical protein